jgi:hypothetical protein
MKKFYFPILWALIAITILLLSACFSPWAGNEGTLTIRLGGNSNRAAINLEDGEQNTLAYTITLTDSDGKTESYDFPAGETKATFKLNPGTYAVTVKGRGERPSLYDNDDSFEPNFPDIMLRAYGEDDEVIIESGSSRSASIQMFPAVEVSNEVQFIINGVTTYDGTEPKKEYIFITNDISLEEPVVVVDQNIELRAEKNIQIKKNYDGVLFEIERGTLTLGKEGLYGEDNRFLHLSGLGTTNTSPLIRVSSGGKLIMHNARISDNQAPSANNSPGILVTGADAEFTMHDGLIDHNVGNDYGGGVSVISTGTFKMYGGEISENEAINGGGGVYVDVDSRFEMSGDTARIRGNKATSSSSDGGGVHIYNGEFIMNGGIIGGKSVADQNKAFQGAGVALTGNSAKLTMNNKASIAFNEADNGGGVFITNGGDVVLNNESSIVNNNALSKGGGVYISLDVDESFTMNDDSKVQGNTTMTMDPLDGDAFYLLGSTDLDQYFIIDVPDGNVSGNKIAET